MYGLTVKVMVINLSYIEMSEMLFGLLGVIGLFAFTFVWCWLEEWSSKRSKRKYDEQLRKYDTWKKNTYSR